MVFSLILEPRLTMTSGSSGPIFRVTIIIRETTGSAAERNWFSHVSFAPQVGGSQSWSRLPGLVPLYAESGLGLAFAGRGARSQCLLVGAMGLGGVWGGQYGCANTMGSPG